jgi:uncharacterized protein YdeI (YjbR/CyaY-like superfamily)
MNSKVDAYLSKTEKWREEFEELRKIILDCDLSEELKWGVPCYSHNGKNIVLIHGFKEYCAVLFFKGALLKDAEGVLIMQTENVQSARQIRFADVKEIIQLMAVLKSYIREAIAVEKAGLEVSFKKTDEFTVADEFQDMLNEKPALKSAFDALTPGRQRAYLLYFFAPKQSKTRVSRIEKSMQKILDGKGLNDD